ncbi:ABC transporter substrate-binding protein [Streptomyces calidiresistens]|nr:ABC transporter substrate-binding protein [Streptomyces calidiresistens]
MGAKGGIGIGLAVLLVIGAVGGWLLFASGDDHEDPIVVGVTDRADSLDPAYSYAAGSWDLYSNVFQSLLTLRAGSDTPVPDAAESCAFTDNAYQVYRCTLRDDLTFSSGREVTPEDVKFSVDRIQAMVQRAADEREDDSIPEEEKFIYTGPGSLINGIEAVRVDGQDVIFELAEPDVTFPYILAGGAVSIVDREEYELDTPRDDGKAVGSGVYTLQEFRQVDDETGEAGIAVLEPNPNYRGAKEVSAYPVTLRYYTGPDTLQEAWDDEEIHVVAGQLNPADILAIDQNSQDIRYSEITGSAIRMIINSGQGDSPSAEAPVRRAVATLIDREAIARQVRLHTVESAYSLIPVGVIGHGTPYYDLYGQMTPADVREELENEGYTLPIDLHLGFAGQVHAEEVDFIAETLEADGIFDVEVTEFPTVGGVLEAAAANDVDSYFVGWNPDFADPDTYTSALLMEDSVLGHGWGTPEIDELIAETRGQPQRANTMDTFREIHALAAEEAVVVPIWQNRNFTMSLREITGIQQLRDAGGIFRLWELGRI